MLAAPTALLFSATEAHELAEPQTIRSLGQGGGADQTMFHARQLAFTRVRISSKKIVRHDQTEDRIAEELERFVVQIARVALRARRDLLMRPRPMRHRLR